MGVPLCVWISRSKKAMKICELLADMIFSTNNSPRIRSETPKTISAGEAYRYSLKTASMMSSIVDSFRSNSVRL